MSYTSEFLSLKSVPNILETVGYLGNKPEKEISEAMAILKRVRGIALKNPNKFQLIDMCSGNALIPVTAAHLFPIIQTVAVDKRKRLRNWHLTKNFDYININIKWISTRELLYPTILTAAHACRELSEIIINLYNNSKNIKHLVLMPCCIGELNSSLLQFLKRETTNDIAWIVKLATMCTGKVKISRDNKVLSPKNYIIKASKEEN